MAWTPRGRQSPATLRTASDSRRATSPLASSDSGGPCTQRWPAPIRKASATLHVPTPNGVKVSIMLEEIGLPYESHRIPFGPEGNSARRNSFR